MKIRERGKRMGFATEMKRLTQDIASSHEGRLNAIQEIEEEAKRMQEQAQELVMSFQANRKDETAQLKNDLTRGQAELSSENKKMLKDLEKTRKKEGAQMRKELAQGVADRRQEIQEMILSMQATRDEETVQLRKDLAQDRANMTSDVRRILSDIDDAQAEVRADLKEAAAIWQELARSKQRKPVRAKPKVIKASKETTETGTEIAPERPQTRNLEEELLKAIEKQHGGITLSKAAENIGVAPIALGRPSRTLLDKGKIRKSAKLYFPERIK